MLDPKHTSSTPFRPLALGAAALLATACSSTAPGAGTTVTPKPMRIGAASIDITPPALGAPAPPSFAACDAKYSGKRRYAFEEPYVDTKGMGQFVPGDDFCDTNKNGRYDGIYLAGGGGQNRVAVRVLDPISAQAVVFGSGDGSRNVALVTVDSLGILAPLIDQIVSLAKDARPGLTEVVVASTHDESAPDPVGLWGPDQMSSGVNKYYLDFLAAQAAQAVTQAYDAMVPARLRFAEGAQPASFRPIWSSYPFVHDPSLMAMQGVHADDATKVIFTLVNYGFHAEGIGYSPDPALSSSLSADWPSVTRHAFEAKYGGVGVGLAGLVGSVETPMVYPDAVVSSIPVSGKPETPLAPDTYTLFSAPPKGTPLKVGSVDETTAIGKAVADSVTAAFDAAPAQWSVSADVRALVTPLCLAVDNQQFVMAATFGILQRPLGCDGDSARTSSSVAVVDAGDAQLAFVPGEAFPFTLDRGFLGADDMPFPEQAVTPWVSAAMTGRYTFFAGLGQDAIGYLMPANDFVGAPGEVTEEPWATYTKTHANNDDRFGFIHNDDPEVLGPHAGQVVTEALVSTLKTLDPSGAVNTTVATGRFVDAMGRVSRSPFPAMGFSGAVGVWVLPDGSTTFTSGTGSLYTLAGNETLGTQKATATAGGFIDIHGLPEHVGFSVATRGVWLTGGDANAPKRVFVDVYPGK